jgi:hypothetical protein
MTALMMLDGPMNGAALGDYAEQVLGPTCESGDIVFMDILPADKNARKHPCGDGRGQHRHRSCS